MSAHLDRTGMSTATCSTAWGALWEPGLHLLSSELQNGLHGVQAGSAEVGDVALHANGFQPLGDGAVGDPIGPTAAGETECHPRDTETLC